VRIIWKESADGLSFESVLPSAVPYERWALESEPNSRKAVTILGSLEADDSVVISGESILVPHLQIARLDPSEAKELGLPAEVPYDLDIRLEGTIDESTCRFRVRWVSVGGRPVLGLTRRGAIASRGELLYRIPEPFYSIVSELERFNECPPTSRDERLLTWGHIQELIGATASIGLDGYLSGMRVYRASSFTLRIDADARGDVNVAPVLLRASGDGAQPDFSVAADGNISDPVELLPPKYQKVFESRFDQFKEARSCYPVESGYFVVVDEPLRKALSTVRKVRDADPATRREYAKNPRAFIRDVLEDEIPESELETLFAETDSYSDRVTGLGLWQPKSLPWLIQAGQNWLPPELELLRSEGKPTARAVAEIEDLRAKVSEAIARGEQTVTVLGREVPATQQSLESLEEIVRECRAVAAREASPDEKTVLLIEDNLETLSYAWKATPRKASSFTIPPLSSRLKPHQVECLRWLQDQWRGGSRGAILADDMGLGKTLQSLAFLRWLQDEMELGLVSRKPLMVVAPTGLLKNWEEEAERHLGPTALGPLRRAYGSHLRELKLPGSRSLNREPLRHAGWVLTTYETLRDYHQEFALIPFSAIVFDEAQKIKNPAILLTEAAKAMRADFTLAMTGTPVENRLADLWCIADVAQPGSLGGLREFVKTYETEDPTILEQLREKVLASSETLPAMMLRRMKADKLPGLPQKHEHVIEKTMPDLQALEYTEKLRKIGKERAGWMLETLHAIRAVSLHPRPDETLDDQSFISLSARFSLAFDVLDQVARLGEKALIFIEFKLIQAQLASLIQRRYKLDHAPMIINGEVSGAGRQERVRKFQSRGGFDVLILSPKAGGVGLTLTAANHVIHLSRWWNPAVEDQCTDRVYRIGQERPVHVYYPLAIHPEHPDFTFDKLLHALIERKRTMSRNLLAPPAATDSDIRNLVEQAVGASGMKP
jgi:hypothetical protein